MDIGYRSGYSDVDMDTGIYIYIYTKIFMDTRITTWIKG